MNKRLLGILLLILTINLVACERDKNFEPTQKADFPSPDVAEETYLIDPIFEEFYASLGGRETLGPAISPLQESGNLQFQFTESAELIFDPQAVASERYRLAPLGLVFGIAEPPVPNPGVPDHRYVNGHVIFADFAGTYQQLGGVRFVGRPLTEARYNPDKGRIEQYFENLGFYILDADPSGEVQLLAYGAFACDFRCRYQPELAKIPSLRPLLPQPFASEVSQLGLSFVGRTLTDPYVNTEGQLEIIFENLVLATTAEASQESSIQLPFRLWLPQVLKKSLLEAGTGIPFKLYFPFIPVNAVGEIDSNGSILIHVDFRAFQAPITALAKNEDSLVYARPIVESLDIQPQPLVPRSDDPLMVFYPLEGDLGHNVPVYFNDYLSRHGGMEISGLPITEVFLFSRDIFRQCFENLCLDFDVRAQQDEQLRPAPLGVQYKERFYKPQTLVEDSPQFASSENIHMQVWESDSFVPPNETQIIYVSVYEDGVPLKNREPDLTLTLPNSTQYEYPFPPTDDRGQSSIEIPPIEAPNGSLIAYQVCLSMINREALCVVDNYLIWKYP